MKRVNLVVTSKMVEFEGKRVYAGVAKLNCLNKEGKVVSKYFYTRRGNTSYAELEALFLALNAIKGEVEIKVMTSSRYIGLVVNNISKWHDNGWKLNGGNRPSYIAELRQIYALIKGGYINGNITTVQGMDVEVIKGLQHLVGLQSIRQENQPKSVAKEEVKVEEVAKEEVASTVEPEVKPKKTRKTSTRKSTKTKKVAEPTSVAI